MLKSISNYPIKTKEIFAAPIKSKKAMKFTVLLLLMII